jgi:mannose-6-phosphate isomerase
MGPLRFEPILKRIRWGGRRLGTVLNKPIDEGNDYAESWEVCDHGRDQSIVSSGSARGMTLHRLVHERASELLGRHAGIDRFPLLLKFLDASDRLSVQVHPNDEQARRRDIDERGKTEAWVILDAEPGSCVFAGLLAQVTRDSLARAIRDGMVERCLHRVPVAAGDCMFIPAGTVHAIGEGVLLAEVQQSSDLTYRLFDWNRFGPDGSPRTLHIDESLASTDFERGPIDVVIPSVVVAGPGHTIEELVRCRYFELLRHSATEPFELPSDDRCHVLMCLEGEARITSGADDEPAALNKGDTLLFPAAAVPRTVTPLSASVLLDVFWD